MRGAYPQFVPAGRSQSATRSGWIAKALMQLQVYVEDVDQFLADQASPWGMRLRLQDRFDLFPHVAGVALLVVRPFGRDTIELEFGVRQRDIRVEAGGGGGDEIPRHVVERDVGVVLTPHVEEDRLDVGARTDRLDVSRRFAVRSRLGHRRGE